MLTICDIELEIQVVDQKVEREIDEALKKCKDWQDQCRVDFSGGMNYENKVNCLESFGVNKTAEYCTK